MIYIPIEIDVTEVIIQNFNPGWNLLSPVVRATDEATGHVYVVQPPKYVVGFESSDEHEVYIMILREGFLVRERRFALDLETKIIRELRN
jgi:hypothetical protein